MSTHPSTHAGGRRRGRREDGAATRAEILEAAGIVFAEKGFDRATGREIAERAGTNSAAVNYYFGGIEGLYGEVLVEAHQRIVSYDALAALAHGEGSAEDKLRALVGFLVRTVMGPTTTPWAWRVLSREVLSPSAAFAVLRERELLRKKQIGMEIIGGMLGVPAGHPAAARCWLSIIAPCIMLLIGDRRIVQQTLPEIGSGPEATEAMVHHVLRFAFAGVAAIREELAAASGEQHRPARRKLRSG
jgi:AcrR family transcriptional regulator